MHGDLRHWGRSKSDEDDLDHDDTGRRKGTLQAETTPRKHAQCPARRVDVVQQTTTAMKPLLTQHTFTSELEPNGAGTPRGPSCTLIRRGDLQT